MEVKHDLFDCLTSLPPSLYASKFIHLLHIVCEEIVSDGIETVPTLYKKVLQSEDLVFGKQDNRIEKKMKRPKCPIDALQYESSYLNALLYLDKPISQSSFKELSPKMAVLNSSIQLFSEIFASPQLNPKNKQQLIKHFIVHTSQQATSKKPLNISKVIAISLAMTLVVKNLHRRHEAMDVDLFNQAKLVLKNCELIKNDLLVRITEEGLVFLHMPLILNDPAQLT